MTHVYRLVVTYPPGSTEPGWEPPGWIPEVDEDGPRPFRWPVERMFLSRSAANHRRRLLRRYGADATIERSWPVVWETEVAAAGRAEMGTAYTTLAGGPTE